jgi:hypothetical protein
MHRNDRAWRALLFGLDDRATRARVVHLMPSADLRHQALMNFAHSVFSKCIQVRMMDRVCVDFT